MKRISIFLIAVILIAGMVACDGGSELYTLTITSSAGGSVTIPGEGDFVYDEGTAVTLVVDAREGFMFMDWTGDVETIADTHNYETTITMNGTYSINANFVGSMELFIGSGPGGRVTDPGEGSFYYTPGAVAHVVATPDSGYVFWKWTGDCLQLRNAKGSANIGMDRSYMVYANFIAGNEYGIGMTYITSATI